MPEVRTFATAAAAEPALARLRELLTVSFDGDFSEDDWQHTLGGWHAVILEEDRPLAHAAVVPRALHIGDRALRCGYVEGVATAPERRDHGLGSAVMTSIMAQLREAFEVGALSTDRHGFYERLGWERWRGPTFVRHGRDLVRTHDEDDGVMVLRFGVSLGCDLTGPIACEARPGDDW